MSFQITFTPGVFSKTFINEFFNEINRVRMNPQSYIPIIDTYTDYPYAEREEAKQFLRNQVGCSTPYRYNPLLSVMAQKWVKADQIGHGNLAQRLQNENIPLTSGSYAFAENIAYGFARPQDIIAAWIVDYMVPDRGHRTNLFKCELDQIGIGYGVSSLYKYIVINEYGTGFASTR